MMSLIICIGMSPSVRIASLLGSGLTNNSVGRPRTWNPNPNPNPNNLTSTVLHNLNEKTFKNNLPACHVQIHIPRLYQPSLSLHCFHIPLQAVIGNKHIARISSTMLQLHIAGAFLYNCSFIYGGSILTQCKINLQFRNKSLWLLLGDKTEWKIYWYGENEQVQLIKYRFISSMNPVICKLNCLPKNYQKLMLSLKCKYEIRKSNYSSIQSSYELLWAKDIYKQNLWQFVSNKYLEIRDTNKTKRHICTFCFQITKHVNRCTSEYFYVFSCLYLKS